MSVHTLQGALELKELGFTRVVLARELSLPEVEHITKHCGIETECFVHARSACVSAASAICRPSWRPQRQPGLLRRALPPAF